MFHRFLRMDGKVWALVIMLAAGQCATTCLQADNISTYHYAPWSNKVPGLSSPAKQWVIKSNRESMLHRWSHARLLSVNEPSTISI